MFNIEVSNGELDEAVRRASAGEEVTLSRGGQVVARLIPMARRPAEDVREAIAHLKELRKSNKLEGLSIREMIEEGRA
jgi:antitoxin (DNA-binding transcriptional repressor) of toxin-antitoxin stability system